MFPEIITKVPGPRSRALASDLPQWENPNITYIDPEGRFPIFWEAASGCLVTDVDGNRFLDLTAAFGVASVGHTNPRVADAIAQQAQKLIHGMGDVHPSAVKVKLAQTICCHAPGDLGGVILGANGGDAIEAAIKSARVFTGKPGVLAFEGGYHGLTFGALAVTARQDFKEPFQGQIPPFARHIPYAAPFHRVEDALRDDTIGAVLVEPVQGRGGIIEPPPGWLADLRHLCDRHGVLLIADEIFTGWGRTGDLWACCADGVVPDILCMGKAMGGGFPISACVARPDITAAWGASTGEALHTSTFLGSPLGCAAALAAIDEIIKGKLSERAQLVGTYFKEQLQAVAARFPNQVRDVRGRGLMLGMGFASSKIALGLVTDLLQCGLIVLPAGAGDVVEFVPPLIITEEQIDFAVAVLSAVLERISD